MLIFSSIFCDHSPHSPTNLTYQIKSTKDLNEDNENINNEDQVWQDEGEARGVGNNVVYTHDNNEDYFLFCRCCCCFDNDAEWKT